MFEEVAFGLTSSKVLRVHRPLPDPAECDARNAASNAVSADGPIGCIWSGPIHDDPGQSPVHPSVTAIRSALRGGDVGLVLHVYKVVPCDQADRQRPAWQKPSTAWPLPAADELFASPMYKEVRAHSRAARQRSALRKATHLTAAIGAEQRWGHADGPDRAAEDYGDQDDVRCSYGLRPLGLARRSGGRGFAGT